MAGSYWLLEEEKDFENCHPERSGAESRDNAVAFVSSLSAACGLLTILKEFSLCLCVSVVKLFWLNLAARHNHRISLWRKWIG